MLVFLLGAALPLDFVRDIARQFLESAPQSDAALAFVSSHLHYDVLSDWHEIAPLMFRRFIVTQAIAFPRPAQRLHLRHAAARKNRARGESSPHSRSDRSLANWRTSPSWPNLADERSLARRNPISRPNGRGSWAANEALGLVAWQTWQSPWVRLCEQRRKDPLHGRVQHVESPHHLFQVAL